MARECLRDRPEGTTLNKGFRFNQYRSSDLERLFSVKYISIAGVDVVSSNSTEMIRVFINVLEREFERCNPVYYLNAHCANLAFDIPEYRRALLEALYVINDGIGLDIAAWRQGKRFKENLNFSDFIDEGEFLRVCADKGHSLFILGGREGVLNKAVANYRANYPGLKVVGSHHGYFNPQEDQQIVQCINGKRPDILLVGLGNPKQELWINKYRNQLNVKLAFSVGGSIDQVAMVTPRAPRIFIKLRLEWFFRLCQEPRRLWKRYLIGNTVFLWRVLLNKM
jgi:N-acetylglucosaminyldiphosphoundecaprenol N-acetyl-beta-D-mannosaminyltransferase